MKRKEEMNGNGNKMVLMAIAVVAVGMFALPSTVSLFTGQHTWYDINASKYLPCEKCHAEIYDEFALSKVHGTLTGNTSGWVDTSNVTAGCYGCHRTSQTGYTYAKGGGSGALPGKEAHAASTVACMVCHDFNNTAGYPNAGGFNITTSIYNYTYGENYTGEAAAHNKFIERAIEENVMEDANAACIACHTYIPVKINWTHRFSLEFDCIPEFDLDGVVNTTHFNVTNWEFNGTYNITVYGNTTGNGSTNDDNWPGERPYN
ncbi:MAG: multiheme c-type cytochrome [Halobacteriota archaeon]